MTERIFGIGLSRTGTLSLARALEELGFRTIHLPRSMYQIHGYEAATDMTVACRFEFLDVVYPEAKFIYTHRELDSWLESCRAHYSKPLGVGDEAHDVANREAEWRVFGQWTFDPDVWAAGYHRHDAAVRRHFQGRPEKLLVLNIVAGDGWEPLMAFLGKSAIPFPHCNKREEQ